MFNGAQQAKAKNRQKQSTNVGGLPDYSMTAPRNLERSEGQPFHSVLEFASPWIVQARRLSRYPLFARRRLNCLRLSWRSGRTRDSKGSGAAPHWNYVDLDQKPAANTRINPQRYLDPSAYCLAQGKQWGLEGRDANVKDSEVG